MKVTESESHYQDLELMSTQEILEGINREDQTVASAVAKVIPQITALVDHSFPKMQKGGRLFYLGAGTSGRLGVIDASELPPTFGADPNWVVGLIAGGDKAIRTAVEFAEDDPEGGWADLKKFEPEAVDTVIGIAASGTTPYVVGALKRCREQGITTGCIVCNPGSPLEDAADFPITVVVGPEFVTGSTRMKAGTAQKLVLNMLSTSLMIRLGRVKGNKMVDMQLNNNKLKDRGLRMVMAETGLDESSAAELLKTHKQVRKAIEAYKWQN